jgi:hypothetical protein
MWLGAGLLVGFAVPFAFTDLLTLPRDLYYAIYAAVAIGFFVLWSKIARPVAGDVVWSVPTLVALNPIGAPIAHAGMHVAAVLHSPQTDTFLPPHQ